MTTLLLLLALVSGGDTETDKAMLFLSGASCLEELSEDEENRYRILAEHPVKLNYAGKGRLLSCGLFSAYQVASLVDYRERNGEILSYEELSFVDGFSKDFGNALKPFTSLEHSTTLSASRSGKGLSQDVSLSLSFRLLETSEDNPKTGFAYRFLYDARIGDKARILWTNRKSYSGSEFGISLPSAVYYFDRTNGAGKVVVGNFAAKFGQGIALWSGFRLDNYSSAAAFSLNGNGIAPTASATPSFSGVAADWNFGKSVSAFAGYSYLSGGAFFGGLSYCFSRLSVGVIGTHERASSFFRLSLPKASLFGEVCTDYKECRIDSVCGIIATPRYAHKYALLLRYYGSGEKYSGIAAGLDFPWIVSTIDCGVRLSDKRERYRLLTVLKPELRLFRTDFLPELRYYGKLTPSSSYPLRHDLRAEVTIRCSESLSLTSRYNAVVCKDFACLWYIRMGKDFSFHKESGSGSIFIQGGLFRADNYEDRIYAYQKDVPGTFNVTAYYGKGWDVSLYASVKINSRHKVYFRIAHTAYSKSSTGKTAKSELRLLYKVRI